MNYFNAYYNDFLSFISNLILKNGSIRYEVC